MKNYKSINYDAIIAKVILNKDLLLPGALDAIKQCMEAAIVLTQEGFIQEDVSCFFWELFIIRGTGRTNIFRE